MTERESDWLTLEAIRWDFYRTGRGLTVYPGLFGSSEKSFIATCERLRVSGLLYIDYEEENVCIYKPVTPFRMWV